MVKSTIAEMCLGYCNQPDKVAAYKYDLQPFQERTKAQLLPIVRLYKSGIFINPVCPLRTMPTISGL